MTQNTDYKLILMDETHLDRVHDIETKCFSDPWSRQAFEVELTNHLASYLLFTDGETIFGYCGLWTVVDEGHITNLGIDPDFQNRGYGAKMMNLVIEWAKNRNICSLTLEVRVSNKKAILLYEKLGFHSAGIRPAYYEDNKEDACIMWIEL